MKRDSYFFEQVFDSRQSVECGNKKREKERESKFNLINGIWFWFEYVVQMMFMAFTLYMIEGSFLYQVPFLIVSLNYKVSHCEMVYTYALCFKKRDDGSWLKCLYIEGSSADSVFVSLMKKDGLCIFNLSIISPFGRQILHFIYDLWYMIYHNWMAWMLTWWILLQ
jgi:hypothetical protein